jgi:hypothetical protein
MVRAALVQVLLSAHRLNRLPHQLLALSSSAGLAVTGPALSCTEAAGSSGCCEAPALTEAQACTCSAGADGCARLSCVFCAGALTDAGTLTGSAAHGASVSQQPLNQVYNLVQANIVGADENNALHVAAPVVMQVEGT